MAVDEAILEHIHRGESLPTLRLYSWEPPCLSLGYAQPFADVDLPLLRARGWDLVRRPTGGRAILHTDELTYSVTAPAEDPHTSGTVLESYNRIARALLIALQELGLPVQIEEHAAQASGGPANPVCFEVPSSYEITVTGRKLVGSAQARRKEGVLQHGSLPLSGDLARITQVLVFQDNLARQEAAARLLQRATTVESVLGHPVDWESAADAFAHAFSRELGLDFEEAELSAPERARAGRLVEEKYAHVSWTERV
jgi:lipoate-protein ligase A